MKKIFCFYPHCLVKPVKNEILTYDCMTYKSLYVQKICFDHTDMESLTKGYIEERNETKSFISSCLSLNMGYYVEVVDTMPFMNERNIKFTTSLEKEFRSLNYNLPSYTNRLLRSITILCNNTHESSYSKMAFEQMEYPFVNHESIDYLGILHQLSSFPCIDTIVIAGELDKQAFSKILAYAKNNGIAITHRVRLNATDVDRLIYDLEQNENLYIEVLIDKYSDLSKLCQHNRLYIKAIINDVDDIKFFENYGNIAFIPVFSNINKNSELLKQMIMTKKEILCLKRNKKSCLVADYINHGAFGHITIDFDYCVFCQGQHIGSLHETDLSNLINQWINKENCMWYYNRSKKPSCKDCALTILCPSVNIYEEQGIYRCPCSIN